MRGPQGVIWAVPGDTGYIVEWYHLECLARGRKMASGGIFGDEMKALVELVQRRNGLLVTGCLDEGTLELDGFGTMPPPWVVALELGRQTLSPPLHAGAELVGEDVLVGPFGWSLSLGWVAHLTEALVQRQAPVPAMFLEMMRLDPARRGCFFSRTFGSWTSCWEGLSGLDGRACQVELFRDLPWRCVVRSGGGLSVREQIVLSVVLARYHPVDVVASETFEVFGSGRETIRAACVAARVLADPYLGLLEASS